MKHHFGVATVLIVLVSLVAPPLRAQDWFHFDQLISETESRVPVAEKQAEVIVRMLNSEKHRAKLQEDINSIFAPGPDSIAPEDTYLVSVLNQLSLGLDKSEVPLRLFNPNYYESQESLLSPNFLMFLARGGDAAFGSPLYDNPAKFLTKERAAQLAGLCSRILALQRPVQLAARAKLDTSHVPSYSGRGMEIHQGKSATRVIYSILIPNDKVSSSSYYGDMVESPQKFQTIDPVFLKYLGEQAKYLTEIGYRPQFDRQSFSAVSSAVQKHMTNLAETSDLSDLTSPKKDPQKAKNKEADSLDDDLKLPPPD